ncbi:hypothetical protein VNO78_23920 [Psophocarpus tetragonolobus]|uniref:Uncharacterized protein n=1 Tax=Psophocarpus tetragonolobus TaxID=3891 RepID=A0AAN9S7L5_PSOTE
MEKMKGFHRQMQGSTVLVEELTSLMEAKIKDKCESHELCIASPPKKKCRKTPTQFTEILHRQHMSIKLSHNHQVAKQGMIGIPPTPTNQNPVLGTTLWSWMGASMTTMSQLALLCLIITGYLIPLSWSHPNTCRSYCGNITIDYPFALEYGCGHPGFRDLLFCMNNVLMFHISSGSYRVLEIDYAYQAMTLHEPHMSTCENLVLGSRGNGFAVEAWREPYMSPAPDNVFMLIACSPRSPLFQGFPGKHLPCHNVSGMGCEDYYACPAWDMLGHKRFGSASFFGSGPPECCAVPYEAIRGINLTKLQCEGYSSAYSVAPLKLDGPAGWSYGIRVRYSVQGNDEFCGACQATGGTCGYSSDAIRQLCICPDFNSSSNCTFTNSPFYTNLPSFNLSYCTGLLTYVLAWMTTNQISKWKGIEESGLICGSSENPGASAPKLMAIMDTVWFQVKERGWGAQALLGSGPPMYALGQCLHDLRPTECYTCFSEARQVLSRCVPKTAGRIYLDGCFLRYDNYSFFGESVDPTQDINICQLSTLGKDGDRRVKAVLSNVTKRATEHAFAVDGEEGVFALAQCWATLDQGTCQRCLREAANKLHQCLPNAEGKCLFTGCFLRFSTRKFYNDDTLLHDININHSNGPSVWMIVACVLSAIIGFLFIFLFAFICCKRIASSRKVSDSCGALPGFTYVAGFSFRYNTLEKATNYFDPANKLGQNGASSVFKGMLPSGRTVAIKRLSFNTRQWTAEFFNEVNLINGIQHKNVVELFGCSFEGPESLLVYEFVPNGSLDQVLFSKDSEKALNWEQRFQIICGIAEGLAYLHGGSGTKIIHRDIKCSNILFDENLNPKIVDFGLARCVAGNKSHFNTENTGTLRYMAPEYVIEGQLTEKADIYAFGVLAVEIVCGKKNSDCVPGFTSVLYNVWKNYNANNITTSVDPALHGKFTVEEASNALQVGLLCTQSSFNLRPSMSEVVQMLTNTDYVIPSPEQQPFLNFSGLSQNDRTISSTTSILSANWRASARSSFHSTTSSLIPNDDLTALENAFSPAQFASMGSSD